MTEADAGDMRGRCRRSRLASRTRGKLPSAKLEAQMSGKDPRIRSPLSHHILPTSSTMIGICMTLVGLVKVTEIQAGRSHVDEYAALAAVIFLISSVASYLSLRYEEKAALSRKLEVFADLCFMIGLVAIVLIGILFAYAVI